MKTYQSSKPYVVRGGGGVIAESDRAILLARDGHDDLVLFPPEDVAMVLLDNSGTSARDPKLGEAKFFHLAGRSNAISDAAWQYDDPQGELAEIAGFIAFDAQKVTVEAL